MPSRASTEFSRLLIPTLIASSALTPLSIDLSLPAVPAIAAGLGSPTRELARTLSVFVVFFGLGQLAYGPISDRWGRRTPLVWALASYAVGSIVCGLAGTAGVFLIGRIIQAMGTAASAVSAIAIARDRWHGAELARVLAIITSVGALASVVAPLVGGWVEATWGWRAIFVLLIAYAFVLALIVRFVLAAQSNRPTRSSTRLPWSSRMRAGARQLLDPAFLRPASIQTLAFTGMFAYLVVGGEIMMGNYGASSLKFGLFFAANAFVFASASALASRLVMSWGERKVVRRGLLAIIAGAFSMLVAHGFAANIFTLTLPMLVISTGVAWTLPASAAWAMSSLEGSSASAAAILGSGRFGVAALAGWLATVYPDTSTIGWIAVCSATVALAIASCDARVVIRPMGELLRRRQLRRQWVRA